MPPKASPRRRFIILLAAIVLVAVLWNVPAADPLLYPVRLFVTFIHEAGHGLAALLTGGRFIEFRLFPNGSGYAITGGGNNLFVLPAGYLGAALFGAVLFYLVNRFHIARTLAAVLAVALILLSLAFGLGSPLALVVGFAFGAVLLLLAWKGGETVCALMLNMLAILTGLNAVLDVWGLVGAPGAALGSIPNDAAAFSQNVAPLIPAAGWAVIWAAIAVALLAAAFWLAVVRPARRSLEAALDQRLNSR